MNLKAKTREAIMREFINNNASSIVDDFKTRRSTRNNAHSALELSQAAIFLRLVVWVFDETRERPGEENRRAALGKIELFGKEYGRQLFAVHYDPSDIVHWYGDICQSLMQVAGAAFLEFKAEEYQLFNECLDGGIAGSISSVQDLEASGLVPPGDTPSVPEVLHEMRNLVNTAKLAFAALRAGTIGTQGATAGVLERSLAAMSNLISGSIEEVKTARAASDKRELVALPTLVREIAETAWLTSSTHDCRLTLENTDAQVYVCVERDAISLAVLNLLHNAFKFTRPETEVRLSVSVQEAVAVIEVGDHCGGIPQACLDTLFRPYVQVGKDRSGIGLGLGIALRAVERSNGKLDVCNFPGKGCVFSVTLPIHGRA
jgi:hypothetical protein